LPRIPIFRGYHICNKDDFVNKFKESFLEEVPQKNLIDEELGVLFNNPVMGKCNIVSQSVSYLRLF
jgi:hypothetical protein